MSDEIEVQKTDYGCVIFDNTVREAVAVNLEDVPKLIKDLQELLPFEIDFNHVAVWPGERIELFADNYTTPIFVLPSEENQDEQPQ